MGHGSVRRFGLATAPRRGAIRAPWRRERGALCLGDPRSALVLGAVLSLLGAASCSPAEVYGHRAPLAPVVTYPSAANVQHADRLWVELRDGTPDTQCVEAPNKHPVCFQAVQAELGHQLVRLLSPSFADVRIRHRGDALQPGDYLLRVELGLNAVTPGEAVGWGAIARGRWQLVRDGFSVVKQAFHSRSRAEFVYGKALGQGAGEVVAAVATSIAAQLSGLPEARPAFPGRELPEVVAETLPSTGSPGLPTPKKTAGR